MIDDLEDPYDILQRLEVCVYQLSVQNREQAYIIEHLTEQMKHVADALQGLHRQSQMLNYRILNLENGDLLK